MPRLARRLAWASGEKGFDGQHGSERRGVRQQRLDDDAQPRLRAKAHCKQQRDEQSQGEDRHNIGITDVNVHRGLPGPAVQKMPYLCA